MSILGNDFEEQIDQVVYDQFIYCDIVVKISLHFARLQEGTFMKIGEIIGPLKPIDDNKLQYIRDYNDIIREINNELILKALGIKRILSINCSIIRENLVGVKLFARLMSGAITQYHIIYQHIKETKR